MGAGVECQLAGENWTARRNACTVNRSQNCSDPAIRGLYLEGDVLSREQAHRSFVHAVNTKVWKSWLSISNEERAGAASDEWWIGQQVHPTPPLWPQPSPSSAGVFRAAQISSSRLRHEWCCCMPAVPEHGKQPEVVCSMSRWHISFDTLGSEWLAERNLYLSCYWRRTGVAHHHKIISMVNQNRKKNWSVNGWITIHRIKIKYMWNNLSMSTLRLSRWSVLISQFSGTCRVVWYIFSIVLKRPFVSVDPHVKGRRQQGSLRRWYPRIDYTASLHIRLSISIPWNLKTGTPFCEWRHTVA
jgi:hypothetical protein